jgi:hypothetical protein
MYTQYSFAHVFLFNQTKQTYQRLYRTGEEAEFERTFRRSFLYTQNVLAHSPIFACSHAYRGKEHTNTRRLANINRKIGLGSGRR